MSHHVDKTVRLIVDLVEAATYISNDNIDAAFRFLSAAEDAFRFLAEHPNAGPRRRIKSIRGSNIRSWPIHGFTDYHIYYRPTKSGVKILGVVHGARDDVRLNED